MGASTSANLACGSGKYELPNFEKYKEWLMELFNGLHLMSQSTMKKQIFYLNEAE